MMIAGAHPTPRIPLVQRAPPLSCPVMIFLPTGRSRRGGWPSRAIDPWGRPMAGTRRGGGVGPASRARLGERQPQVRLRPRGWPVAAAAAAAVAAADASKTAARGGAHRAHHARHGWLPRARTHPTFPASVGTAATGTCPHRGAPAQTSENDISRRSVKSARRGAAIPPLSVPARNSRGVGGGGTSPVTHGGDAGDRGWRRRRHDGAAAARPPAAAAPTAAGAQHS